MNLIDRNKLIKMFLILFGILFFVWIMTFFHNKNSVTLVDYAQKHGDTGFSVSGNSVSSNQVSDVSGDLSVSDSDSASESVSDGDISAAPPAEPPIGKLLNGGMDGLLMISERKTFRDRNGTVWDDFYMEPLSENLLTYMTGVSYPKTADVPDPKVRPDELRYLHILHYNFDGEETEGELVCHESIAADLLSIFCELYRNEYQIESVKLIDEFQGDDTASITANNTSCFNYRPVEGTTRLSKHAYGLAIDINPFYNPYITYNKDGSFNVSPEGAEAYADRSQPFPYKIDENDLCYKLFVQHGFTWGGNWNSVKDYQHFQKAN